MFNAGEMGQKFLRLIQLKDSAEMFKQAHDAGVGAEFAEHYILADASDLDEDDTELEISAEDLGLAQWRNVPIVSSIGGDGRWHEGRAGVVIDIVGLVWLDAALHDEIFC